MLGGSEQSAQLAGNQASASMRSCPTDRASAALARRVQPGLSRNLVRMASQYPAHSILGAP